MDVLLFLWTLKNHLGPTRDGSSPSFSPLLQNSSSNVLTCSVQFPSVLRPLLSGFHSHSHHCTWPAFTVQQSWISPPPWSTFFLGFLGTTFFGVSPYLICCSFSVSYVDFPCNQVFFNCWNATELSLSLSLPLSLSQFPPPLIHVLGNSNLMPLNTRYFSSPFHLL